MNSTIEPPKGPRVPPGSHWLLDWAATLATVFLSGATLTTLMRWLAVGKTCDAGGAVFSGVLAFVCYRYTLSENCLTKVSQRQFFALGLPILWALFFPIVMWGLGFR